MKSVIICDMEGVIQEMNKGALDMFGYTKDELIGIKRVSIFSEADIVIGLKIHLCYGKLYAYVYATTFKSHMF